MLADAVAPHGGVVMWRAFVYSHEEPEDRAKQAYNEFTPLDGRFRPNVLVQVKNGPIDFQPREPFHPLFGAMPKTPLMMEFQITQEYLGLATHLAFLAPLWEEVLRSDTFAAGPGSPVSSVVDGTLHGYPRTGMAGSRQHRHRPQLVRVGDGLRQLVRLRPPGLGPRPRLRDDRRRVAPDDLHRRPGLRRAGEGDDARLPRGGRRLPDPAGPAPPDGPRPPLRTGPLGERRAAGGLDLGLLPPGRHRGNRLRPDDDRLATRWASTTPRCRRRGAGWRRCPEEYLLWFHHVPWDHRMASGRTLWEELLRRYQRGVDTVRRMQETWRSVEGRIDPERYEQVRAFLAIQEKEARWWRDACVLYFQTFSERPLPEGYEPPEHTPRGVHGHREALRSGHLTGGA